MTKSSNLIVRAALVAAAVCTLSTLASAQAINGIRLNERAFNDFTTSTLVTTNTNSNPGTVTINETGYINDGVGGNFANRHNALASSDGGATARVFNINESFTTSMIINLADGSNAPRKEAGFEITGNPTGAAKFIINSDAGEIVAFGGGAPFKLFGNNGGGNGYTPGTSLFMAMRYTAGQGGAKGTLEYLINRTAANGLGAGLETSGPLLYDNLEGGPVNFTLSAYAQITPANVVAGGPVSTDFATVSFTNFNTQLVPEPTTLAALAVGGAAMIRRRRSV